jgi:hypothetical protein
MEKNIDDIPTLSLFNSNNDSIEIKLLDEENVIIPPVTIEKRSTRSARPTKSPPLSSSSSSSSSSTTTDINSKINNKKDINIIKKDEPTSQNNNLLQRDITVKDINSNDASNILQEEDNEYTTEYCIETNSTIKVNKRCEYEDCKLYPSCNHPGEIKRRFCNSHKLPGMENVTKNRCEFEGCKELNPIYNIPSKTKGKYCNIHKLDNMVNLGKQCLVEGCKSFPLYCYPKDKDSKVCLLHKDNNMILFVEKKICEYEDCTLTPTFNLTGEDTGKISQFVYIFN